MTCPGILTPSLTFYKKLHKILRKYNILLIIDEVGTGFGRTGKMFGFESYGIKPDIVTFAKGIASGYGVMGAVATSRKIADSMIGKGGTSTFGWQALAMASAIENLKIINKEKLELKAEKDGKYIQNILNKELKGNPKIGEIRGMGLEIGIEIVKDQKSKDRDDESCNIIEKNCLEKGLHITWSGRTSTMMIMPPLVITRKELDMGLEILIEIIKKLK